MGIFAGGAFLLSLALSRLVGMVILAIQGALARRGWGSWRLLSAASFAVAAGCVAYILYLWAVAPSHPGAPSGDDYDRWIFMALALGASAGFGLTGLEARSRASSPASPKTS
jgi:hypothetical protein